MTFADLGHNPPDEIIADDLLAVALLDITWRPQAIRILLGSHKHQFTELLAALPRATHLWNAPDVIMKHIDAIWDALTVIEGIGTASASKLLARKRPRLCPISDSVVIKAIDVPGRTWDVLRCLLQDPDARVGVEALRPVTASEASLLRLLDVAIWVLHSRSIAAQWLREQTGLISGRPASE
jgi:hypothetical protein